MTKNQKAAAQQAFLESFQVIGVITRAAIDAGVSRRTVYNWLKNDGQFQERFKLAEEDARDELRAEMWRRAVEGWDVPVYYRGNLVGKIRKYSDALLLRMAYCRLPEYHQARQHERPETAVVGAATTIVVETVELGRDEPVRSQ